MTPFWIVWSPEGTTPPRRKYTSKAQAVTIAKDMTAKHPGQRFFAMETVAGFVSEVRFTELLTGDATAHAASSPKAPVNPPLHVPKGGGTFSARWVVEKSSNPQDLHVGAIYPSQKGSSRIVELRNVDGRVAIVVYKPEDRPTTWKEARWATHLGDWWSPDKLRTGDPLNAYGRTPQPFSLPALYVLEGS